MPYFLVPVAIVLLALLTVALKTFGMNQEYERAVLFRLGRLGHDQGARLVLANLPFSTAWSGSTCAP